LYLDLNTASVADRVMAIIGEYIPEVDYLYLLKIADPE
jgi:hypothetical protein